MNWSWAFRSESTRCRSSASPEHSPSSTAARSAGSSYSTAAKNSSWTRFGSGGMRWSSSRVPRFPASFMAPRLTIDLGKGSVAEGVAEPGPGVSPLLAGEVDRDAQGGCSLIVPQTRELVELDDLGRDRVFLGQAVQGVVEGE